MGAAIRIKFPDDTKQQWLRRGHPPVCNIDELVRGLQDVCVDPDQHRRVFRELCTIAQKESEPLKEYINKVRRLLLVLEARDFTLDMPRAVQTRVVRGFSPYTRLFVRPDIIDTDDLYELLDASSRLAQRGHWDALPPEPRPRAAARVEGSGSRLCTSCSSSASSGADRCGSDRCLEQGQGSWAEMLHLWASRTCTMAVYTRSSCLCGVDTEEGYPQPAGACDASGLRECCSNHRRAGPPRQRLRTGKAPGHLDNNRGSTMPVRNHHGRGGGKDPIRANTRRPTMRSTRSGASLCVSAVDCMDKNQFACWWIQAHR